MDGTPEDALVHVRRRTPRGVACRFQIERKEDFSISLHNPNNFPVYLRTVHSPLVLTESSQNQLEECPSIE